MADKQENKFPTEVIDLPSGGRLYPPDSPLAKGKLEIKYMTAREEDILTSQNLIKKGVVIDKLLDSLIVTQDVKTEDLLIGDKNAVMVAARILAYGPEYECEIVNPETDEKLKHKFNLADCPFKVLPDDVDYSHNEFEVELPASKLKITIKLLTGKEEKNIDRELKSAKKYGQSAEITTRLKYSLLSVDGETDRQKINNFASNMLSKDSFFLRKEITRLTPDIDLKQDIDIEGDLVTVAIPMTVNFFWPDTTA